MKTKAWRLNLVPCTLAFGALIFALLPSCSRFLGCHLSAADAPEIRGLQLGMTEDEVRQKFPFELKILSSGHGMSFAEIGSEQIETGQNFQDLHSIDLEFLDGNTTNILLKYSNASLWNSADDLAHDVGEKLGIKGEWQSCKKTMPPILRYECRSISCTNLDISAGLVYSELDDKLLYSFVEMTSTDALRTVKVRRQKLGDEINGNSEERQKVFRP